MKKFTKPLIVMLCIMLVCGSLLAILSNLLYVSEDERIERAINKIYQGENVSLESTVEVSEVDMSDLLDFGEIKACYLISNGDYLVLSKGKKGYSNGTVSTYVAISSDVNVKKVVEDSYTAQTLMSKLSGIYENYIGFSSQTPKEDIDEVIVSGATYSSNAVSNSVYVAIKFVERVGGNI